MRIATDFDGGERLESRSARRVDAYQHDIDADGYDQYAREFAEQTRPDLSGIWHLATIEANGRVDRFAELLAMEHPRGLARKDFICLNEMRSMLRAEIRARIIAERTLEIERSSR